MDTIATDLGISKKTIYQHFPDKDTMVFDVVKTFIEQDNAKWDELNSLYSNVIEKMFKSFEMIKDMLTQMDPRLLFEIQKYFPNAYQLFVEHGEKCIQENLHADFKKGAQFGYFRNDIDFELLARLRMAEVNLVFGHFEIAGFEMDRGNVCRGGIDKNKLNKYDMVITGHFHHKSDDGHIYYVGTPTEMTWADYNDPRGFHIFDLNTRELEFVQNPYRMFHKLNYDDGAQDFDFWKAYDFESLKESYVKVIVINKQNPYLFDNVIDNLYKAGVADISIVEDFTDTSFDTDQEIIDQAEDTMTILSKHIDNLTLNVNNEKLKTLMRELYVEALNTETTE